MTSLNPNALPFTIAKSPEKGKKDTNITVTAILNFITMEDKKSKEELLIQVLGKIKVESGITTSLVDQFIKAAAQNVHNNTTIALICDLTIITEKELKGKGFMMDLTERCLNLIETYQESNECEEKTEKEKDTFLGCSSLLAKLGKKDENIRKKVVEEVKLLTAKKGDSYMKSALKMYREIAVKLDEKIRDEIVECFKSQPRSNFISVQIDKVLQDILLDSPRNPENNDEVGSETNSQESSSDESEMIFYSAKDSFFCLSNLINKPAPEKEIRNWMFAFIDYVKTMDHSELIGYCFGHQTVAYFIELANVICNSGFVNGKDLLKELCNLCVTIHNLQIGGEVEHKFRTIMCSALKAKYDESYLFTFEVDESRRLKVLAMAQFIAGLYEVNFIYGTVITMEIKQLLQESCINVVRLECAVILLRDCFDKLDKSCRSEITPFYEELNYYSINHQKVCKSDRQLTHVLQLMKEMKILINKREKQMQEVRKDLEAKVAVATPPSRTFSKPEKKETKATPQVHSPLIEPKTYTKHRYHQRR